MTTETHILDYWNSFYKEPSKRPPSYPSQFAAFVAGEIPDKSHIIEFGCGSGRDTEFFASLGHTILGIDGSESAINACRRFTKGQASYLVADVTTSHGILKDFATNHGFVVVYARFFLHAITIDEQQCFLQMLSRLLGPDAMAAFEYRTDDDAANDKSFGDHFRRYINHAQFCESILGLGFELRYQVKGKGLAKYKTEDAEVGRIIVSKNGSPTF